MAVSADVIATLRRAEQQLEQQLQSVRTAIAALSDATGGGPRRRRPAASSRGPGRPAGTRRRRKLSAKARAAISAAQKARWAKQRAEKR
jgi:hypothetical protein